MAITGKIVDFFLDKTKSIVGFPRTKVKAVSDDNNVSLDVLLDNINTTADNARSIAENAKSAVDNAMPKSGGTFTGDVKLNGGLDISSFRDCSDVPFNEITLGRGAFIVNWNGANAADGNVMLGISDGWTALAMSRSGVIYITARDKTSWEAVSIAKSGGTFTGAVQADSGIRAGDYLRNICIKENSGDTNIATMTVYFRRK